MAAMVGDTEIDEPLEEAMDWAFSRPTWKKLIDCECCTYPGCFGYGIMDVVKKMVDRNVGVNLTMLVRQEVIFEEIQTVTT